MSEQGYNGWKNYETWSVALIIDNDPSTYAQRDELVRGTVEHGEPSEYWSEDERKRYRVADALKDWITGESEEAVALTDRLPLSFLWSQLISAALWDVDWEELAVNFLADLEPSNA